MKNIVHSLQTKLIGSFILLIVVIAGGIFLFTFNQTKVALLNTTRDDMSQIIGMASTQLTSQDVDVISQFQAGQEKSNDYIFMQNKLKALRSLSPNIVNFYIVEIKGKEIFFKVDDYPVEEDGAKIGQLYEKPEPMILEAINEIKTSNSFYTDEWGTYLSAYAPLKDAKGETAYILGSDMEASKILERQNFIGNTIYTIMGFAILIAALIIGVFSVTIIRDIKKLNKIANEISTGNTNVQLDIHRDDEIGELAESFGRMVASLKIMMANEEPK